MKYVKHFSKFYILILFVSSFIGAVVSLVISAFFGLGMNGMFAVMAGMLVLTDTLFLWLFRKTMDENVFKMYAFLFGLYAVICGIAFMVTGGSSYKMFSAAAVFLFPLFSYSILNGISGIYSGMIILGAGILLWNAAVSCVLVSGFADRKRLAAMFAAGAVSAAFGVLLYTNSPEYKYKGHGFAYMHGFSSTDFSDYMVWKKDPKLVRLDHPASFMIENEEDMPVLDGAEACYPMYASFAANVYQNIGEIEKQYVKGEYEHRNGRYVSFTNSVRGYVRLISGEADMFFGAKPSDEMDSWAKENNDSIVLTPIGKEAFVFFVEQDNPVTDLTAEQMKAIYSGQITNWKEVGGKDQEIIPFQRPAQSGSQIMMEYFMGDTPLREPKTYEVFDSMTGVIQMVAQYHNEKGALGYTFRYFLEGLHQEKRVRMLSIDGVEPTVENIKNGTYPLVVPVYCAVMESNRNENVQKMLDWILSEEGQEIVERSGYAPVK